MHKPMSGLPASMSRYDHRGSVPHRGRPTCYLVRGPQGAATISRICVSPMRWAHMAQPTLSVQIKESVLRRLVAQAERAWPGQDTIGRDRLVRDALLRIVRYGDGKAGTRGKS